MVASSRSFRQQSGLLLSVATAIVATTATAGAQSLSASLRIGSPPAIGSGLAGKPGKIIVGPQNNTDGRVYVIDSATGATLVTLVNPAPSSNDRFGHDVAWVGDNVVVGVPFADINGPDRGIAYLFDGTSGALLHTFSRPEDIDGWFGWSVTGVGDDALIGVRGLLGPNGEGAYLFDGATGGLLQSFADPNAGTPDAGIFGVTVESDGSEVLVASTYGASAVYRFDLAGSLLETYQDPEPDDSDEFGEAVAIVGTHVAIGVGTSGGGGKVYLFDAAGTLEHTYTAPFVSDSLFFGSDLAAAGGNVAIGSNDGVFVHEPVPPYDLLQELHAPAPFSDDRDAFGHTLAATGDALAAGALGSVTVFDPCGNGVATAREQCDDGNPVDGDGCSTACLLETCGAAPALGCTSATKAQLAVRDENSIYGIKDSLKWIWQGAVVDLETLGDPNAATDLVLCVYDLTETVTPRLRMQPAVLAAGTCAGRPCWKTSDIGWAYRNKNATPSGVTTFSIKSTTAGTKVKLAGKGPDLGAPPSDAPLSGQVMVQLRSSTAATCLETVLPPPALLNDGGRYKDRAP